MEKSKVTTKTTPHLVVEPVLTPPMKTIPEKKQMLIVPVVILVIAIGLGVGTGFVFAKKSVSAGSSSAGITTNNSVNSSSEAGLNDTSAFPDTATGLLVAGGINGEGTHHLDRTATKEKNVALTSTVINLDNFVGKKVEIHGQTISSKTSGWLMDVGKIKVAE